MKFSIGMKLAAGLGGVALIAAVVGGFGLWTASTIDDGYAALIAGEVAVASAGEELDTAVEATLAAELAFVLDHEELGVEASAGALEHAREEQAAMDAALVEFVEVAAGTEFEGQAAALEEAVEHYDADFETLVTVMAELGDRETGAVGAFVSVLGLLEEDLSGSAEVERLLRFAEQFLASPTAEHGEVFLTQLGAVPETEHTADVAARVPALVEGFGAEHEALEESAAIAAEIDATIAGIVETVEADEHAAVEAMHARSDRAKIVLSGLILVGLVIAAVVAAVMSRSFSSAARTMSALADAVVGEDIAALLGVAETAAQGDLTTRFDVTERRIDTSRGDELGDIARSFQAIVASLGRFGEAFNRMLADLADTVGGIKEVAFNVSAGSQTTATGSEETARGAGEIAASITEVANAVTSQATQSELMLAAVEDIEAGLRATIEALGEASEASDAARQGGAEGRLTLEATTAAMERITQAIGVAARHIEAMGRSSQQVEEMVDVIRSIAEQTNLLALNAAIEAARAGEMGRGFAVVASEVKALAEESAKSSERVASVVGEMRQSVDLAVTSMNDGLESVAEGGERIGGVTAAFGVIDTTIQAIGSRVETLGGLGQQIAGAAERIRVEAESMAATAESNSAATEQVAAASEESAAISEELGATSEELAAASEELTRLVARFRTD